MQCIDVFDYCFQPSGPMEKLTHIELTDIQCEDAKPRSFDLNVSSIVFQVGFYIKKKLTLWRLRRKHVLVALLVLLSLHLTSFHPSLFCLENFFLTNEQIGNKHWGWRESSQTGDCNRIFKLFFCNHHLTS